MEDQFILLIRLINAAAWIGLASRLVTDPTPAVPAVRNIIMIVVAIGMTMLVIGALVPYGLLNTQAARFIYTGYTAVAAIAALAIITGPWRR